jgi:methyltransferase (TIGR00027 family)
VNIVRIILGALAFLLLEVMILPVQIVAVIVAAYYMIYVSSKLNTSMTALKILEGRILMHWFGLRTDRESVALARNLPNFSLRALSIVMLPLVIFYRMSGHSPIRMPKKGNERFREFIYSRTVVYDDMIQTWSHGIDQRGLKAQFVHLGAGYDTRSMQPTRFGFVGDRFEIDHPRVQQIKRDAMADSPQTGEALDHLHFVAVDFEKEGDWRSELLAQGLDVTQPMIFLWEGVTLYLDGQSILKTLEEIKTLCEDAPSGTCTLLTGMYSTQVIDFTYEKSLNKTRKILNMTGESLKWGLPFESPDQWESVLHEFVDGLDGFTLRKYVGMGTNNPKGPYLVCTEMIIHAC